MNRSLGRGAVVAGEVHNQSVLIETKVSHGVEYSTDLGVGVGEKAGEDFHKSTRHWLVAIGVLRPRRHLVGPRREFGSFGDNAELELAAIDLIVQGVPALVELSLELVNPFGGHMVGAVHRAGGEVQEEGSVGITGPLELHPLNGVIGQVFSHVVVVAPDVRSHGSGVSIHRWLPLGGLGIQDAVEVVKTNTSGPAVERPGRRLLPQGRQVPLAKCRRGVTVLTEYFGHGGRLLRNDRVVPGKDVRRLGDATHVHGVVVTSREHGGSWW